MSGNGEIAEGVKVVGYLDCPGGGQIVVKNNIAYMGNMESPYGTTIADVSDPKNPHQIAQLSVPPGTHSHKVRVENGIMLINREALPADPTPPRFRWRPRYL